MTIAFGRTCEDDLEENATLWTSLRTHCGLTLAWRSRVAAGPCIASRTAAARAALARIVARISVKRIDLTIDHGGNQSGDPLATNPMFAPRQYSTSGRALNSPAVFFQG